MRCKRCGRTLTNPESIRRQYGPVCWRKVGGKGIEKIMKGSRGRQARLEELVRKQMEIERIKKTKQAEMRRFISEK